MCSMCLTLYSRVNVWYIAVVFMQEVKNLTLRRLNSPFRSPLHYIYCISVVAYLVTVTMLQLLYHCHNCEQVAAVILNPITQYF